MGDADSQLKLMVSARAEDKLRLKSDSMKHSLHYKIDSKNPC